MSLGEARFDNFLVTDAGVLVAERAASRAQGSEWADPVELPEVYRLELSHAGALGPDAPGDGEEVPSLLRIPLAPDLTVVKEVRSFEVSDFGIRMWAGADPGSAWADTWLISWGGVWWGDVTTADGTWWIRPTPDHGTAVVRAMEEAAEPFGGGGVMMSLSEEEGESTCDDGYQLAADETPDEADSAYMPAAGEPIDVGVGYTGRVMAALMSQWTGYANYGGVFGSPDDTPFGVMPGNPPVAVVLYVQSRLLQTNHILLRSGVTERGVRLAGVVRVREALPDPVAGGTLPLCAFDRVEAPFGADTILGYRCLKSVGCSCCPDSTVWRAGFEGVYEKGNEQFKSSLSFQSATPLNVLTWQIDCSHDWRPVAAGGMPGAGDHDAFPDPPNDPMGLVRQATTGSVGPLPLHTQVDGTLDIDHWRALVGADLVGVLQSDQQLQIVGVAHNQLGVNKQPLLKRSHAGFVAAVTTQATNEWTFSHELAHTLGIVHGDELNKIWSVLGVTRGNSGFRAAGPVGDERTTLVHSGNSQNVPRLPVLSNRIVRWQPGPTRIPTGQQHRLDGSLVAPPAGWALGEPEHDAANYLQSVWAFGATPLQRRDPSAKHGGRRPSAA